MELAVVKVLPNWIPLLPHPPVLVFLILLILFFWILTPEIAVNVQIPVGVPVLDVVNPAIVLPDTFTLALATPDVTTIPLGADTVPLKVLILLPLMVVLTVAVAAQIPVILPASSVLAILLILVFATVAPSTPCTYTATSLLELAPVVLKSLLLTFNPLPLPANGTAIL